MEKIKVLRITSIVLLIAICVTWIWGYFYKKNLTEEVYDDGIEQIDLDTIYLTGSGVQADFYDVLVGTHNEVRKLIVSTQEATVSTELTDYLIAKLDIDFLKKTQKISYTGNGYFVVDLDKLTKDDIVQDKKNKTITMRIDHAYLEAIEIDPDKVIIDEVKESLLARGDIKLTVSDYNAIEKELRKQLDSRFNTAKNAQEADAAALRMVQEIYEPIVKAVDAGYELRVEFKQQLQ